MKDQEKACSRTETQAFIDAVNAQGGKPLYELSYKDARKVLEDAQSGNVTKLPANVEERVLPVGPRRGSVRIYRPIGAVGLLPVVMYFHAVVGYWAARIRMTDCCGIWSMAPMPRLSL